jgi:hypothetical protein
VAESPDKAERIVIALSKVKVALVTAGALLFVALGVWLLEIADLQRRFPPLYVKGASVLAIGFFGLCGVYALFKLFDDSPGLILDREGFIDNSSGIPAGRVAWREIREIRVVSMHRQRFLAFMVDDPQKYLGKGSLVRRVFVRMNYRMYGTPILIGAHSLKMKFDELERLIAEFRR